MKNHVESLVYLEHETGDQIYDTASVRGPVSFANAISKIQSNENEIDKILDAAFAQGKSKLTLRLACALSNFCPQV